MKKIAIYGTGRVAEYFMNNYDFKGEKLSLFIETKKSREEFLGYPVIDLKDVTDDIDIIYFANTYADTVFAALEQGINPEKMVVVNKLLWETFIARNGEKNVKYISEFAEKYEGKVYEFIDFISDKSVAVDGTYRETWKYIEKDKNSLQRHSNMHLIFKTV